MATNGASRDAPGIPTSSTPTSSAPRRGHRSSVAVSPIHARSFVSTPATAIASMADTTDADAALSRAQSYVMAYSAPSTASGAARQAPLPATARRRSSARPVPSDAQHPAAAYGLPQDPSAVDLLSLDSPDVLFAAYQVRDVRIVEKRASDAAESKVSELRTMVGERYRDLLSAADSIIRMQTASDALVKSLDKVVDGVSSVEDEVPGTPSKSLLRKRASSSLPAAQSAEALARSERSLSHPYTLSLAVHLFLSLASLVHAHVDRGDLLGAARLEGVGHYVHSSLATAKDSKGRAVLDMFPIVSQQWGAVAALGPMIVRRSQAELTSASAPPLKTAETLAAIVLLEHQSVPEALERMLEARSRSLATVIASGAARQGDATSVETFLPSITEALTLLLRTAEGAAAIFGSARQGESAEPLLLKLMEEIEKPSATSADQSPRLAPVLSLLPNYSMLSRHLPQDMLDFAPFLSRSAPRNVLAPASVDDIATKWLRRETHTVVSATRKWIASASGGAAALQRVHEAIHAVLDSSSFDVSALRRELDEAIEARVVDIAVSQLSELAAGVATSLASLLIELPSSRADIDPSFFLFEQPLPFPRVPVGTFGGAGAASTKTAQAAFDSFLAKVEKRTKGETPLVERAHSTFKTAALALQRDLEQWLGARAVATTGSTSHRRRQRDVYLGKARETLGEIESSLAEVLRAHDGVHESLFLGSVADKIAGDTHIVHAILLDDTDDEEAAVSDFVQEWSARLVDVHSKSLVGWRNEAVKQAVTMVGDATEFKLAAQVDAEWQDEKPSPPPATTAVGRPSAELSAALSRLLEAVQRLGTPCTRRYPAIVPGLLSAFATALAPVVRQLATSIPAMSSKERHAVASRGVFDLLFLEQLWPADLDASHLESTKTQLTTAVSLSEEDVQSMREAASSYLRRTQTIFSPLLPRTSRALSSASDGGDAFAAHFASSVALLPLGPPPSQTEFKSITDLSSPGPRLGLLPVRS